MKSLLMQTGKIASCLVVLVAFATAATPQAQESGPKPLVLTAQIQAGKPIYKLNGKEVENRTDNSLLKNLAQIVDQRGTKIPVYLIVDERAPLTEVGKLETALDKADLTNRRLFVGDFRDGTMNEIHWEQKALPIPKD